MDGIGSPSLGREWIEIYISTVEFVKINWSPSLGREWIEMITVTDTSITFESPSLGREWIEIVRKRNLWEVVGVSLLGEGVD